MKPNRRTMLHASLIIELTEQSSPTKCCSYNTRRSPSVCAEFSDDTPDSVRNATMRTSEPSECNMKVALSDSTVLDRSKHIVRCLFVCCSNRDLHFPTSAMRAYSSCNFVLSRSPFIHLSSERCSPRPHPHAHQRIIASKALRQEQSNQTNQEPKTEKTGRSGEIEKTKSDVETNTNTNANYDRETQQRTNKGPCDRRAEWYLTRIGARRNQRVRRCVQCWGSLRKLSV